MADVRNNWSDLNSTRSFPLEETASKLSDSGERMPDGVLVAARLKYPNSLGARVCVGGVTVGPGLATVTFVATDASFTVASAVLIATVSVPQPVEPGRLYPIKALSPGVGGWVAFGQAAGSPAKVSSWRFGTPANAPVIRGQAEAYEAFPVPSVAKRGSSTLLTGIVKLLGDGDFIVEGADREIDGQEQRVILVRLNRSRDPLILHRYAGPCAGRPESRTCDFTPITRINGVTPDPADGNLTINFMSPFVPTYYEDKPWIGVNFPISLLAACAAQRQNQPAPSEDFQPSQTDQCEAKWYEIVPESTVA
jgi:hypothetical protein